MSTPRDPDVTAARTETPSRPSTDVEAADLADRYDRMSLLAGLFDESGDLMRDRALLGAAILADPAYQDSVELAPATAARADEDIRAATTGKHGLVNSATALDADSVVLRATVQTYRWIDDLQLAAYQTLGSIAGRAIGYFAPQVELGGALVSAGLIETDELDREGVASYLNELASSNPELLEHVSGGGLLDGLAMRSLLTSGFLAGDSAVAAGAGGMLACGATPLAAEFASCLRDVAGALVQEQSEDESAATAERAGRAPVGLAGLLETLGRCSSAVEVHRLANDRFVVYLPGPDVGSSARLRLVDGDPTAYAEKAVREIERTLDAAQVEAGQVEVGPSHVMLVGRGQGGTVAARIASNSRSDRFVVDQIVTAGSPSAHAPRLPETTRMLSLEDRSDPVALLGSLINLGATNRVTVVVDTGSARDEDGYLSGARTADASDHPELQVELDRLRGLGYLSD